MEAWLSMPQQLSSTIKNPRTLWLLRGQAAWQHLKKFLYDVKKSQMASGDAHKDQIWQKVRLEQEYCTICSTTITTV